MVNFHAVGKYFQAKGGAALLPEKHSASLSICAFLKGGQGSAFPATQAAYYEALSAFAPDDLFALLGWLDPHLDGMSIPQILAVLRLSRWDPVALMRLFPAITRQVRDVTNARHDLRNAVLKTWANHFPVTAAENALAFQCGVVLLELRFFADALPMFETSQQVLGRSAPTSYNLGLCYLGLDRGTEAIASIIKACELDPNFEPARLLREKLGQSKT
jgi:tetratricopeptide (TPR) repeat protein